MGFVMLFFASIITVIIIVGLIKGKEYISLVENLDSSEYFMKDFYIIGFYLNNTRLFRLRGKLERNLKSQARLVWDNIYYEYYANLAWAQFLSIALVALAIGFTFCSLLNSSASLLILGIVLISVMALWNVSISKIKETIQKRREECEYEFPNMVSKLSLLINSGMVLREAWYVVADGKEGTLYDLMKKACENMENGDSEQEAIHKFGILSDSPLIKKFTSAMIQGLEKGNSELVDFLVSQASELWAHKRQLALQKGEIAAGKLVIPLGLMFGGVIMIIVAAAMQSMSF